MTLINNDFQLATLTTECVCHEEDGIDEVCFGDCYEWQQEDVYWLVMEWAKEKGFDEDTAIRIEGKGMGWTKASGYKISKVSDLDTAMNLDGDFRLEYRLQDGELTVERFSHDEPAGGCVFTFTKVEED